MQVGVGACEGGQVSGEHVTVQSSAAACYSMHAGSTAKLQDCVATGAHPCMILPPFSTKPLVPVADSSLIRLRKSMIK